MIFSFFLSFNNFREVRKVWACPPPLPPSNETGLQKGFLCGEIGGRWCQNPRRKPPRWMFFLPQG